MVVLLLVVMTDANYEMFPPPPLPAATTASTIVSTTAIANAGGVSAVSYDAAATVGPVTGFPATSRLLQTWGSRSTPARKSGCRWSSAGS
jgi:hypothetical protein